MNRYSGGEPCKACLCAHFIHNPHSLEISSYLRARDSNDIEKANMKDAEQENMTIQGEKIEQCVVKNYTA